MKILFLTRRYYPHIGGVEKHIALLSQELITRGHSVKVLAESHKPITTFKKHAVIEGVEVFYFYPPTQSWFKKFFVWIAMLKRIRLFFQADIIHAHDVVFWTLPFLPLLKLMGKKVYATFHGDEKEYPPRPKAIRTRRFNESLVRASIDVGTYLQTWYGTQPNIVTHGAVEEPKVTNQKKDSNMNPDDIRILLLGRLDKDISIDVYVKTFNVLKKAQVPYSLDICGDGTEKDSLRELGTVHGFVHDVEPFIAQADIVCASSYLAILEALAQGKPVVAVYENPMKKDYLSMAPFAKWICVTDDPEEAGEYIQSHGQGFDSETRKKVDAYIKKHSWSYMADVYETLWKK